MSITRKPPSTPAAIWFSRVMWIGIVGNFLLAGPSLVAPAFVLSALGLPVPSVIMWPQFAALLLILLSLFYIPAAMNPDQYRASAVLAVASRLAGVLFFFLLHRDYWMFGAFDLVFFVPEALLLWRMPRAAR